jgi:hypothetical protein
LYPEKQVTPHLPDVQVALPSPEGGPEQKEQLVPQYEGLSTWHTPPQSFEPAWQETPHTPLPHEGWPLETVGQGAQPPQWFGSLEVLTHEPPQSTRPPLHALAHLLALHTCVEPQAFVHAPQ